MADDQNLDATTPEEGAAAEAVEVPAWVPEKFRGAPEKFGEAYSNLEREFHQTRQELKAQQETLEAYILEQQQVATVASQAQQLDPWAVAYQQAMDAGEYGQALQIQDQMNTQRIQQVVQQQTASANKPIVDQQNEIFAYTVDRMVATQLPDWDDQKGRVSQFVQTQPWLLPANGTPQETAAGLVAAYKAMRYDELHNQSQTQAEQLAHAQEVAKRNAQTLTGHPGRPEQTDADNDYWKSVSQVPSNKFGL